MGWICLVTQRYKTALICSGVTARTSIVTYCSLTISPQSCSFFFPFPLPPFLGIPLVRARYAQALVRLGLDKYFMWTKNLFHILFDPNSSPNLRRFF